MNQQRAIIGNYGIQCEASRGDCDNDSNSADSGTHSSEDTDPDLTPRRSWTGGILQDLISLIAFLALLLMPTGTVKVNRLPLRQCAWQTDSASSRLPPPTPKTIDAQPKVGASRDQNTARARARLRDGVTSFKNARFVVIEVLSLSYIRLLFGQTHPLFVSFLVRLFPKRSEEKRAAGASRARLP